MNRHNYSPFIKGIGMILLLFIVQVVVNLINQQAILANFENFVFVVSLYIAPYILSFTEWNLFYQFLIFLLVSFSYFTARSFLGDSYVDYSSVLLLLGISIFTALVMAFLSLIFQQRKRK